ncbi:MAG: reductive dehalogenase domain-containing protein [Eubacteriales bacterium]
MAPIYDERDVIFARMNYDQDQTVYDHYYTAHPEKERMDKISRRRPLLGDKLSCQYNPIVAKMAEAPFAFLEDIGELCQGEVAPEKQAGTPAQFSEILMGYAKLYGATHVGITTLKPEQFYTHKGLPNEKYNDKIDGQYKFAIVFTVEMDKELIDTAPYSTHSIATSKGYVQVSTIGMVLSYFIRSLGYEARNNMDGNYELPLPPVAQAAGLGEMGIHGLLVTPDCGPRVRLGVVTTNIPLEITPHKPMGIRAFCETCHRCAKGCVSHAIENEHQGNEHGFYDNICLSMWQRYGSDCGVCIAMCPFANHLPPELVANLPAKEGRVALAEYCAIHFAKRTFQLERPDWVQAAYPPKK